MLWIGLAAGFVVGFIAGASAVLWKITGTPIHVPSPYGDTPAPYRSAPPPE